MSEDMDLYDDLEDEARDDAILVNLLDSESKSESHTSVREVSSGKGSGAKKKNGSETSKDLLHGDILDEIMVDDCNKRQIKMEKEKKHLEDLISENARLKEENRVLTASKCALESRIASLLQRTEKDLKKKDQKIADLQAELNLLISERCSTRTNHFRSRSSQWPSNRSNSNRPPYRDDETKETPPPPRPEPTVPSYESRAETKMNDTDNSMVPMRLSLVLDTFETMHNAAWKCLKDAVQNYEVDQDGLVTGLRYSIADFFVPKTLRHLETSQSHPHNSWNTESPKIPSINNITPKQKPVEPTRMSRPLSNGIPTRSVIPEPDPGWRNLYQQRQADRWNAEVQKENGMDSSNHDESLIPEAAVNGIAAELKNAEKPKPVDDSSSHSSKESSSNPNRDSSCHPNKDSPRPSSKESLSHPNRESPKPSNKDSPSHPNMESSSHPNKESPRPSNKESLSNPNKDSPSHPNKESSSHPNKESSRHSSKASSKSRGSNDSDVPGSNDRKKRKHGSHKRGESKSRPKKQKHSDRSKDV